MSFILVYPDGTIIEDDLSRLNDLLGWFEIVLFASEEYPRNFDVYVSERPEMRIPNLIGTAVARELGWRDNRVEALLGPVAFAPGDESRLTNEQRDVVTDLIRRPV